MADTVGLTALGGFFYFLNRGCVKSAARNKALARKMDETQTTPLATIFHELKQKQAGNPDKMTRGYYEVAGTTYAPDRLLVTTTRNDSFSNGQVDTNNEQVVMVHTSIVENAEVTRTRETVVTDRKNQPIRDNNGKVQKQFETVVDKTQNVVVNETAGRSVWLINDEVPSSSSSSSSGGLLSSLFSSSSSSNNDSDNIKNENNIYNDVKMSAALLLPKQSHSKLFEPFRSFFTPATTAATNINVNVNNNNNNNDQNNQNNHKPTTRVLGHTLTQLIIPRGKPVYCLGQVVLHQNQLRLCEDPNKPFIVEVGGELEARQRVLSEVAYSEFGGNVCLGLSAACFAGAVWTLVKRYASKNQ